MIKMKRQPAAAGTVNTLYSIPLSIHPPTQSVLFMGPVDSSREIAAIRPDTGLISVSILFPLVRVMSSCHFLIS